MKRAKKERKKKKKKLGRIGKCDCRVTPHDRVLFLSSLPPSISYFSSHLLHYRTFRHIRLKTSDQEKFGKKKD